MADPSQDHPSPDANSTNGNDDQLVPPPPPAVNSASAGELSSSEETNYFLVAKNSIELHKKRTKLRRPHQSLPTVLESDDELATNVLEKPPPPFNSNSMAGKSSLAALKNHNTDKKKVEWADLHEELAPELQSDEMAEWEKMDTSDNDMEWYTTSDSDTEQLVSLLPPNLTKMVTQESQIALLPNATYTPESMAMMDNLVRSTGQVNLSDDSDMSNSKLGQLTRAPATTDITKGQPWSYDDTVSSFVRDQGQPYLNPFDTNAPAQNIVQTHMESEYDDNYKYYTPQNSSPEFVDQEITLLHGSKVFTNSKCPSPLNGQFCPFPRQDTVDTPEFPPSQQIIEIMQPELNTSMVDLSQIGPDNTGGDCIVTQMQVAPTDPSIYDDDEFLEPDKPAVPTLPRIDDMWIPTVANVAATLPAEQHHLIEPNCKKDCRTWLWKSSHQREERYRKPDPPL